MERKGRGNRKHANKYERGANKGDKQENRKHANKDGTGVDKGDKQENRKHVNKDATNKRVKKAQRKGKGMRKK